MSEIRTRYYLRFQVLDRPGVLALICGILGSRNISIASVKQKEVAQPSVPLVITTHMAREADIQNALREIRELSEVVDPPVLLRIEDLAS